jgi:hypothetical protein
MEWLDLHPLVARGASNCPNFVMERAIRESAIEFCERTDVYQLEETIFLTTDFDEYEVTPPENYEVCHYLDISLVTSNTALQPTSLKALRAEQRRLAAGTPAYFASLDNTHFFIAPKPAKDQEAAAIFSVKPTVEATEIPDTIGQEHREAIAAGALTRLLAQADAPWRDMQMSQVYGRQFRRDIHRVARQVKYGFGGASLRAYHREFF